MEFLIFIFVIAVIYAVFATFAFIREKIRVMLSTDICLSCDHHALDHFIIPDDRNERPCRFSNCSCQDYAGK